MVGLLVRRAPWILGVALILTGVSAVFAIRLYQNLRTDVEELLPTQARSVKDLAEVQERMEATQSLAVLVFSEHPKGSKRFVTEFARTVSRELPDLASHVEYRIDEEIRFFEKRRALMLSLSDLRAVRDYIDRRLRYEEEIRNPLNIFNEVEIEMPTLNREALGAQYASRVSDYTKFKDGYYATSDGKIRVVLVYLSGSALGVTQALRLKEGVERIIARLGPGNYAPDLDVKFTGDVQNLLEERASLIADLELSTLLVAVLVMAVLAIYYRNLRATAALIVCLFAGTLWTFGAAYFAVGYLNANSAFLGSIVLGNGINFGLILLAFYLEERRRLPHEQALPRAMRGAFPGTLAAALAASLAYGSLGLTSFRGFKQFGVIGLIGMLLCWSAAFTVLPAMLTVLDRRRALIPKGRSTQERRGFAYVAAQAVGHYPRALLVAGAVITVVLAGFAARQKGPMLETDTSQLRDRRSLTQGSGYLSRHLDEIFGRYLSPLVVLPHTRVQTRAIVREMKAFQKTPASGGLISNVYSIDDFVPENQAQKIRVLREIQRLLPPKIVRQLSPEDARLIREALTPEAFRSFGVKDLPPMIRARFREKDGTIGKPVLVEPVFDPVIMNEFSNQKRLIDGVRGIVDRIDPRSAVVGQLPLTVDLIASISRDGPRATLFAFLAVLGLAVLLFRRPAAVFHSTFSLLLGVFWMVCFARIFAIKINFLNFIALPITFGIGVDYGVNLLARVRREGTGQLVNIVATTGGAVSLASLTTIIGYGSLLIAGNQGFVSFGKLAILGELTCLFAAVIVLPSFLRWRSLRKERPMAEREQEELRRAA